MSKLQDFAQRVAENNKSDICVHVYLRLEDGGDTTFDKKSLEILKKVQVPFDGRNTFYPSTNQNWIDLENLELMPATCWYGKGHFALRVQTIHQPIAKAWHDVVLSPRTDRGL